MRKNKLTLPVPKPRNAVVRALLSRLGVGAGRHPTSGAKRTQNKNQLDLAQRVRDVGEW